MNMLDFSTIRPGGETVHLHEVKFLGEQWRAPKVLEEIVCDDVEFPSLNYLFQEITEKVYR